jgi:hypothetical protein
MAGDPDSRGEASGFGGWGVRTVAGNRMPFRGVDSSGERPHRRAQKNRLPPSAVLHWVSGVFPADGWGG